MAAYTVYLDQVFLGNLVMNYAILWAASKISRVQATRVRLVCGAALGAVYALAVLAPGYEYLLSLWFKIIISTLMLSITFAPLPPRKFLACLGTFYLASFALGGITLGMIFFIHSGEITSFDGVASVVSRNFWPGVLLGLAAFWVAGRGITSAMNRGVFDNLFKMNITIINGETQIKTEALLDTGNQLHDPMTGCPVIVVEYAVMKPLLPMEIRAIYEQGGEPDVWQILQSLGHGSCAARFSAVPFQSLGRGNGLMLGFRPEEVLIEFQKRQVRAGRLIVGICREKLDARGAYHALLTPNILETTWP